MLGTRKRESAARDRPCWKHGDEMLVLPVRKKSQPGTHCVTRCTEAARPHVHRPRLLACANAPLLMGNLEWNARRRKRENRPHAKMVSQEKDQQRRLRSWTQNDVETHLFRQLTRPINPSIVATPQPAAVEPKYTRENRVAPGAHHVDTDGRAAIVAKIQSWKRGAKRVASLRKLSREVSMGSRGGVRGVLAREITQRSP